MIRFAVFTDLHYDHIPDGDRRIKEFLDAVRLKNPDFILSLGDLCYPAAENRKVIDALEQSGVPVYHTIGNHDTDQYSLEEVMDFLKIESSYYSFLIDDVKFIVLNTCYIRDGQKCVPFLKRNYDKTKQAYPWLPQVEADWLLQELESEDCYYVVFSHHSLANDFRDRGIANREAVRALLENRKVLFCMNGHDHGDGCTIINGIPYITLNSMSYIWHGMKELYAYDAKTHEKYPSLKNMILYQEPLHAFVEISDKEARITGMDGHYHTIIPEDAEIGRTWNGVSIEPKVLSRTVKLPR